MTWSKIKQNLEGFLSPELEGVVEYRATGYRYLPDKSGQCYIAVNKKEILSMRPGSAIITWYQNELEIKTKEDIKIPIQQEDIDAVRKSMGDKVPEERLVVIAEERKIASYAKEMIAAQGALCKSDFYTSANLFLSEPLERCLESKDILLNIFALMDRRLGKKRLLSMEGAMKLKHPAVQYFYELRKK